MAAAAELTREVMAAAYHLRVPLKVDVEVGPNWRDLTDVRDTVEAMVLGRALELEREHVQQHLAVAVGVDVPEVLLPELALQARRVGEVAVVAERDAEREMARTVRRGREESD